MDQNVILINGKDMSLAFDIEDIYKLEKKNGVWIILKYNTIPRKL